MNASTLRQKIGLALAGLLLAVNVPSAFQPTPPDEIGAPFPILVVGTVLAVIGIVAVALAFLTGRTIAVRAAAGCLILITLTTLPAFFADVPAALRLMVGLFVLATVVALVLMLVPAHHRVGVQEEVRVR